MRSFPKASRGLYLFMASLPAASFLASCGGSSGGKTQSVSYSITGTVVNLAGTGGGLQLLFQRCPIFYLCLGLETFQDCLSFTGRDQQLESLPD